MKPRFLVQVASFVVVGLLAAVGGLCLGWSSCPDPQEATPASRYAEELQQLENEVDCYLSDRYLGPRISNKELILGLVAMQRVHHLLNPARYGYLALHNPDLLPQTAAECIATGAGICGNQTDTWLSLVRDAGLEARSVEFYGRNEKGDSWSHAAAEMLVNGKWRFLDVMEGVVYLENKADGVRGLAGMLSLEEIAALDKPEQHLFGSESSMRGWAVQHHFGPPHAYLKATHSVLRGKKGTLRFSPVRQEDRLVYVPMDVPCYVGQVADYGDDAPAGDLVVWLTQSKGVGSILRLENVASRCPCVLEVRRGKWQTTVEVQGTSEQLLLVDLKEGAWLPDDIYLTIPFDSTRGPAAFSYERIELLDFSGLQTEAEAAPLP